MAKDFIMGPKGVLEAIDVLENSTSASSLHCIGFDAECQCHSTTRNQDF